MANPALPTRYRVILAASLAVGVSAVAALGLVLMNRESGQHSAPAALATAIEAATARLDARPLAGEPIGQKAIRVRNAIKRDDYATARRLVGAVLAASRLENWRYYPFDDFIDRIPDVADPEFGARLNEWIDRDKADPILLLIRAKYYYDLGWFKRGHRFASATKPRDMASFEKLMKLGLADIDQSMALDRGNPYAYYLKLVLLRGFGMSKQMKSAFEEGIAVYPGYYQLYDTILTTLQPKWGGSIPDMYAFVDRYAGHADKHSPLKFLYLSLYRDLLSSASIACDSYPNGNEKMARCVASVMGKTVTPALENYVVTALRLYDHTDKAQYDTAIRDILDQMLDAAGGDVYSGAVLQLAASAMHSDTQLVEEKPTHDDYVIDEVVAESWLNKGFYDNALKKDQEALRDIREATFSDEEQKDSELSRIYHSLAEISGWQGRYVDMIAYEKAALVLGGSTDDEHFICYAYYRLQAYKESIRACTRAMNNRPGNLTARYWRGMAYRKSGQTDAALRDLTVVADSESGFRFTAAIEMSVIYGERRQFREQLEVLTEYKELYDPRIDSKTDVAVSYNNRCYAYMQLGELQKALDDCTASLSYASLPDAYRKQQELVKRLGDQGGRP